MTEKGDFGFEDNDFPETDLSGFDRADDEIAKAFEETVAREPVVPQKNNSMTRLLLMVLLLVVAGGAGFYYLMGLEESSQQMAKTEVTARQPVPAKPPQPAPEPQLVKMPVKVEPEPAKQPDPVQPPGPAKPEVSTQIEAAKPEPPASAPADQHAVTMPDKIVPAPAAAVSEGGMYELDAGAYLLASSRRSVVEKIQALGYEARITEIERPVEMTRMRLGTFAKPDAEQVLSLVREMSPEAFLLQEGDQYTVYAGTFFDQGNISALSDLIQKEQGVKPELESIVVMQALSQIRFGSFNDKAQAEKLIALAKESGLTAHIVTTRQTE